MTKINYKKLPFNELIYLTQNSDIKATAEFLRRIQKNIYTFFCHLCPPNNSVSDLTQEALIKIVENIKNLKNVENFKKWSNKIALNTFYDSLRKEQRRNKHHETDEIDLTVIEDHKSKPLDNCHSKEICNKIKACIINLPLNYRLAIVLRELEGLSYEEIAKLTNTNLGTVKSRISRAREKLQTDLAEYI